MDVAICHGSGIRCPIRSRVIRHIVENSGESCVKSEQQPWKGGSSFAGFCLERCQHAHQSFRLLLGFSEFFHPVLALSLLQVGGKWKTEK
ncbi:uncharacterized protein Dyak_GE28532 [Drosophila yakuba]|uniref:Uncharacterized protein n=1 Tax=Drosophila yakuba TaxID=7245 RepID=A0A0R1DQH9_DROYA|nr:uncharacterized protein Dyak_GE28532 [Drosophila yakuba]